MSLRRSATVLALLLGLMVPVNPAAVAASELRVAATIAPVHSLVAMVTDGFTAPSLIIRPGASPHNYALKPSEAEALDQADVVFWVGGSLEPWMAKAVTTLAGDANVVELGEVDGIRRLAFRRGGVFDAHDHGEADEHGDHDHHHDSDIDPHLWLDPENAAVWLDVIASTLAEADPANATGYLENAENAVSAIEATVEMIETLLQPVQDRPYVVFHDAYQYFERRFDLHPLGSISLSDADRPGPARLIEVREAVIESGAACIFAEPQFEPRLIETVIEGSDVAMGTLDPIGAGIEPGAELYPKLLLGLAESLVDCLG